MSLALYTLITLRASGLISISASPSPGYVTGWVCSPSLPFLFSLPPDDFNLSPFKSAWFFDLMMIALCTGEMCMK